MSNKLVKSNISCKKLPLNIIDKIEIIGDYTLAFLGLLLTFFFPLLSKYILTGFLLCVPFEYIQPKLGWVCYYKCITYKYAPKSIMWFFHSIWDSYILYIILNITIIIFGDEIYKNYNLIAALFMSFIGMIQEISIECTEILWFYIPTKFNPTWAIINGRNMTLQQWHWSILPPIYYYIVMSYNI